MLAWWKHVAPRGARLRVHAIFDGDELVGLAPFFADRGFGGLRRYRLLAAGTSAPLDILAREGMEEVVATEVARWLASADPAPELIIFGGLRSGSPWPRLIRDRWPRAGAPAILPQYTQREPFIQINGTTHRDWLAKKSSDFRRKVRREREVIEKLGVEVGFSATPEEVRRDLADFARLHHGRWRARGGSGVLDERVERMLLEAGSQLVGEGRFRLWSMRLDGRVISSQLLVVAGGETCFWLGGFDDGDARIRRPGVAALLYALDHAFEAGDGQFCLGPGAQGYKYEITRDERSLDWVMLVPRGWRAPLARVQLIRQRTRQLLARRVPPWGKRLVRRAIAISARLRGA